MVNIADPDQTAPEEAAWPGSTFLFHDMSVRILGVITLFNFGKIVRTLSYSFITKKNEIIAWSVM